MSDWVERMGRAASLAADRKRDFKRAQELAQRWSDSNDGESVFAIMSGAAVLLIGVAAAMGERHGVEPMDIVMDVVADLHRLQLLEDDEQ